MSARRSSRPVPVKYWSFAGIMLTYWCSARCASCYLCCGPDRSEWMEVELALRLWRELVEASPHGCKVHISGGEPFGDWDRLIGLCTAAQSEGLGPPAKIETSAFWATDEQVVRLRVGALDAAGMTKLVISTDPYHQQFIPIERARLAARVARDVLGADRLQVRWRDWLENGFDTAALDESERAEVFAKYAIGRRDRYNGRAAALLGPTQQQKPVSDFADSRCDGALLRSKHVHIGPDGRIIPGTCGGIVLGSVSEGTVGDLWRRLEADRARRPVVGRLAAHGPVGLLAEAESLGFAPRAGYAGKCHLCWDIRSFLSSKDLYRDELGPVWMYGPAALAAPGQKNE